MKKSEHGSEKPTNCVPGGKQTDGKAEIPRDTAAGGRGAPAQRRVRARPAGGAEGRSDGPPRPRPRPDRPRPGPPPAAVRALAGSMAAAAGAPPPGPQQSSPPPPPEESSDSEPEAEPGSPQKLIRKVSTSGQIRQKVSRWRRPGRAPLAPRQPREARGAARAAAQARPGVPRPPLPARSAPRGVTGRALRPRGGRARSRRGGGVTPGRGRRWATRGAGRVGRRAGVGVDAAVGREAAPRCKDREETGLEVGGEGTRNGGSWRRPAGVRFPSPGLCALLRTGQAISRRVLCRLPCVPLRIPVGSVCGGSFTRVCFGPRKGGKGCALYDCLSPPPRGSAERGLFPAAYPLGT